MIFVQEKKLSIRREKLSEDLIIRHSIFAKNRTSVDVIGKNSSDRSSLENQILQLVFRNLSLLFGR